MRILATLTVRNEAKYIQQCLAYHIQQGVSFIVIDNDSTDHTRELCEAFLGKGLLKIEHLPYPGHFDLTAILQKEAEVQQNSQADWLIHLDADEILQSNRPGETLAEAIHRIDAKGYGAINFDEFVFLPENSSVDYTGQNFVEAMQYYYFFCPHKRRTKRRTIVFKKEGIAANFQSGGHRLEGKKLKIYPKNFFLRHYIGLSESQLKAKYGGRIFAPQDLEKGWHGNRNGLRADQLQIPPHEKLEKFPYSIKKPFSKRRPYKTHFWDWE